MRRIIPRLIPELKSVGIIKENVASHDAYEVQCYDELRRLAAKLAYANKDYILFFRGQKDDFKNQAGKSSFYPSIYRGNPLSSQELQFRWRKLEAASRLLADRLSAKKQRGWPVIRKQIILWSILQHYNVTETPLIDVTQSLKVACSFSALERNEYGYIYIFGLPYYTNRISVNSEHYLTNVRLISISPPDALRPYYQEGFLVGEDEFDKSLGKKMEMDLNRRLIAKFKFKNNDAFWGDAERKLAAKDMYPADDIIADVCEQVKKELYYKIAPDWIDKDSFQQYMLKWEEIEKILRHVSLTTEKQNITNASLIKYLGDNELQSELESIRKFRNNLAHNIHVSQKISLDKISTIENMLNEYITKKLIQSR